MNFPTKFFSYEISQTYRSFKKIFVILNVTLENYKILFNEYEKWVKFLDWKFQNYFAQFHARYMLFER